jgi:putative ABC transport system permease protein
MKPYDWLLFVYPRHVRDRFAEGMRTAFAEDYARARARGLLAGLVFVATTIVHTLLAGLAERLPRTDTIRSFFSTDLRDAVRSLCATPVVTLVAVLSLALGIGANTALFSILHSLVLKPLPVAEPERLALLVGNDWTNPIWEQIRERQTELFDGAFAWAPERFNLAVSGPADAVQGGYVSGSMFPTLGISARIGRLLTPADDVRGGGPDGYAVVVSHRFWQQRLGGREDVVGRPLTLDKVSFTIVGVAPDRFPGPEVGLRMDVFLPIAAEGAIRGAESTLDGRSSWWLQVMVRLQRGQTVRDAEAALNGALAAIREATLPHGVSAERRASYLRNSFVLASAATGVSSLRKRFAQPLTIIMIVVVAVLLIACANIANLMLARAAFRRHEMTVRLALGASRARLGCQLFVESLLLAVAGAAAGLALARVGAAMLVRQLGSGAGAVALDLSADWRVLGFTAMVAMSATLLFGLAPALGMGRVSASEVLKEQSRTVAGDRRLSLRNTLVIAQVALSFALIAGAGLFVRTFTTLVTTPLGFDPDNLLIVSVDARQSDPGGAAQVAFFERVAAAAASATGVSRASLSFMAPMSGRGWNNRAEVPGGPVLSGKEQVTWLNAVAPGWFETLGMRVLTGRDFTSSDVANGERVAIVNETFARRFVGPRNPIGQRIKIGGAGPTQEMVIVGLVNDAVYRTARSGVVSTMYLPMTQGGPFGAGFSIIAKLGVERHEAERSIAAAVNQVDPKLALSFRDYSDLIRATVAQERLVATLAAFFGGLAMLLAALGLYGVTAYSVSRRRAELAVRIALGASTGGVVRLVLGRLTVLLLSGLAIGSALILWAGRFIGALLFRIDARDPQTLMGAAAVLMAVGLLAGWLPARGVSRLDPTTALRE